MALVQVPLQVKEALGKHLKEPVLAKWVEEEKGNNSRGSNQSGEQLALSCYQRFLYSDLRYSSSKTIGFEISAREQGTLEGTHVIQLNECFNCTSAAKYRFEDCGRNRCLKMQCTDGLQDFIAVEFQFIPSLSSCSAAGTKLLVKDAPIRKGSLLLSPACAAVLGGEVAPLEGANKRKIRSWNKVVCGGLGIKKVQHVDSVEKLYEHTMREALEIQKNDEERAVAAAVTRPATTTTPKPRPVQAEPTTAAGPHLEENRTNTIIQQRGPPPPTASPISMQRSSRKKSDGGRLRLVRSSRDVGGSAPDQNQKEEDEQDPFQSSDPQTTLGGGGVLPSLSPLSESLIPTLSARESPSFQQSYRLPVWAEAAAHEMAEKGADDLEMTDDNKKNKHHSSVFVDSQARAGSGVQSSLELTRELTRETTNEEEDDDDPVQDLQVDVDLVSNSESSSFHDDIKVQTSMYTSGGTAEYMLGTNTNFTHLADIGSLQPGHQNRVIIYNCTIHDVMSLSLSDGKYQLRVSIEDGSDMCEVALCHEVVEKHFGITPAELKGLSASEKQTSQRNLEKHFALWQGYMEIEKDAASGALIALSMEQPHIDTIRAAVNWLGS